MREVDYLIYGLVVAMGSGATVWARRNRRVRGWMLGVAVGLIAMGGAIALAALCALDWRAVLRFGAIMFLAGAPAVVGQWIRQAERRGAREGRYATTTGGAHSERSKSR